MAVTKAAKKAFADRVASLREDVGLTQVQLGRRVGVTQTCIWNWENGNTFPRENALARLAQALETTPDVLAAGASPRADRTSHQSSALSDIILEARRRVAAAAGAPLSKVRVVIDWGD